MWIGRNSARLRGTTRSASKKVKMTDEIRDGISYLSTLYLQDYTDGFMENEGLSRSDARFRAEDSMTAKTLADYIEEYARDYWHKEWGIPNETVLRRYVDEWWDDPRPSWAV